MLPLFAAFLGSAYLWSGRVTDAVPLLEEAVEASTAMGNLGRGFWFSALLAEACLVLGRVAEARAQAEQAVAQAGAHQERGREAWNLKQLGDVHAHEPAEAEQAGDRYRQALALATELGMRPLIAHCHLGLGKLSLHTGKREQVDEHLTTATALYREMDMRFWLEQGEAELKELG